MTEAEARTRLASMLAASEEPRLTQQELDELLLYARVRDRNGNLPDPYFAWKPSTVYRVGDRVVPTRRNGHVYEVSAIAGESKTAAAEPAFPLATGATVVDGSVTWREVGLAPWAGVWLLRRAAAEGWNRKAGKAAGNHKFTAAGDTQSRQRIFEHCREMAKHYGSSLSSARVGTGLVR